jgi:hypothetical protein
MVSRSRKVEKNWTTEDPELFGKMTQIVAGLIRNDHWSLSCSVYNTAGLIIAQLAHKHGFIWLNFNPEEVPENYDWTTSLEGRANSSDYYRGCVETIAGILNGNLLQLLTHNEVVRNTVSAQILTVLANLYEIVPPEEEVIVE